jgi:hypothetical protein
MPKAVTDSQIVNRILASTCLCVIAALATGCRSHDRRPPNAEAASEAVSRYLRANEPGLGETRASSCAERDPDDRTTTCTLDFEQTCGAWSVRAGAQGRLLVGRASMGLCMHLESPTG